MVRKRGGDEGQMRPDSINRFGIVRLEGGFEAFHYQMNEIKSGRGGGREDQGLKKGYWMPRKCPQLVSIPQKNMNEHGDLAKQQQTLQM